MTVLGCNIGGPEELSEMHTVGDGVSTDGGDVNLHVCMCVREREERGEGVVINKNEYTHTHSTHTTHKYILFSY